MRPNFKHLSFVILAVSLAGCIAEDNENSLPELSLDSSNQRDVAEKALTYPELALRLGQAAVNAYVELRDAHGNSFTRSCPGTKSANFSLQDNDNSGTISVGDRLDFFYDVCQVSEIDADLDGLMRLTLTDLQDNSGNLTLAGSLAFSNLEINSDATEFEARGSYTLNFSRNSISETLRASRRGCGFRFEFSTGADELLCSFDVSRQLTGSNYSVSLQGDISSDDANGSFELVEESIAFNGTRGSNPLGSGRLDIEGFSNSELRITTSTAQAASVNVREADQNAFSDATDIAWSDLVQGFLFDNGSSGGGGASCTTASAQTLDLGSTGFNLSMDDARKRIFVTLPGVDQLAVVDSDNFVELRRVTTGDLPRGLALSNDASEIQLVNSDGQLQRINTTSFAIANLNVVTATQSGRIYDMVNLSNNRSVVSADSSGAAFVGLVDRDAGDTVTRVADGLQISGDPRLVSAGDAVFVSDSRRGGVLRRLDASSSTLPVVATSSISLPNLAQIAVSNDANRLLTAGGNVLDGNTLASIGSISAGAPAVSADNSRFFSAIDGETIVSFDASTRSELRRTSTGCASGEVQRLLPLTDGSGALLLVGTQLCKITCDNGSF